MESSAVVQRTRDGSADMTVAISDASPRKASTPGCTNPFGPSIQSVAERAYVAEPTDVARQPGHRRRGCAPGEKRPELLHARKRREPGIGHASPCGLGQDVRRVNCEVG